VPWIAPIDGLRAIAALAVVLHHISYFGTKFTGFAVGNLAVAVFFGISGFLAYRVLHNDAKTFGDVDYNYFITRRILRIWPAYFIVIALVYVHHQGEHEALSGLISLLTFTSNVNLATGGTWPPGELAPMWSIAVEEQFYLLAPFMFAALRSSRAGWFVVGIIAASNCARAFYIYFLDHQAGNRGVYYMAWTYADTFLAGALVSRGYLNGARMGRRTQVLLFLSALGLGAVVLRVWGLSVFPPYSEYAALPYALLPILVGLLLASVIPLGEKQAWYQAVLGSRPFVIIGTLSYSIYLIHLYTIYSTDGSVIIIFAKLFALSSLLYVLIEKPFLILKRTRKVKLPFAGAASLTAVVVGHILFFCGLI
jgi:peptidoglycan/LPS O-acetylase OafA/YrhL